MNVNVFQDLYSNLVSSYKSGLNSQGGFLPSTVPGVFLPDSFGSYTSAIKELPIVFSPYEKKSIRDWLNKKFSGYSYNDVLNDIDHLDRSQRDHALSIFSILIQSYRWDKLPADAKSFSINHLSFPESLYIPWKKLSNLLGLPCANTYWSVIACNWTLKDRSHGEYYQNGDLSSDNLKLLYSWLPQPYSDELENFILSFVEMEAKGALAINTVIDALDCIAKSNKKGLLEQLLTLNKIIKSMGSVFSKRIRKSKIAPDNWRDIIHVPFAWGLTDENNKKLEGASGMQVGAIATLNSFLSIPENSSIGTATRNSRIYLLPKQRKFLSQLDNLSIFTKNYVQTSNNLDIIMAYNNCLESIMRWRISHQKRGTMYLSHNVKDDTPQIATGLTLPQDGDQSNISDIFTTDMEERIQETKQAMIETT